MDNESFVKELEGVVGESLGRWHDCRKGREKEVMDAYIISVARTMYFFTANIDGMTGPKPSWGLMCIKRSSDQYDFTLRCIKRDRRLALKIADHWASSHPEANLSIEIQGYQDSGDFIRECFALYKRGKSKKFMSYFSHMLKKVEREDVILEIMGIDLNQRQETIDNLLEENFPDLLQHVGVHYVGS